MNNLAAVCQPCSDPFIVHQSAKKALSSTLKRQFLTLENFCTPFDPIYYLSSCL